MAVDCIDTKAKCRHLKKLTCKGIATGVYLSVLFTRGGGEVNPERWLEKIKYQLD
jgi:hypothetical protein